MMTPAEIRADYRKAFQRVCWNLTIRRLKESGGPDEAMVLGRITQLDENELVNGLKQGDRKAIVLAEDLEAGAVTLPLVTTGTDKVADGATVYSIQKFDENARKVQGVVVAYEIIIRGGA